MGPRPPNLPHSAWSDTDTGRDYEYSDWADLRRFAVAFGRLAAQRATAPAVTASV